MSEWEIKTPEQGLRDLSVGLPTEMDRSMADGCLDFIVEALSAAKKEAEGWQTAAHSWELRADSAEAERDDLRKLLTDIQSKIDPGTVDSVAAMLLILAERDAVISAARDFFKVYDEQDSVLVTGPALLEWSDRAEAADKKLREAIAKRTKP